MSAASHTVGLSDARDKLRLKRPELGIAAELC